MKRILNWLRGRGKRKKWFGVDYAKPGGDYTAEAIIILDGTIETSEVIYNLLDTNPGYVERNREMNREEGEIKLAYPSEKEKENYGLP